MCALSQRSSRAVLPLAEYARTSFATFDDMFSVDNPNGYISLGIAENRLSIDLVASALAQVPPVPPSNLTYTLYAADPPCAKVLARFLSRHILKCPVEPGELVITCGAAGTLDLLAFSLCDPGDCVLVLGPGYRGFERGFFLRSGTRVVVAHASEDAGFSISVDVLEKAWHREGGKDSSIRFLVVCSPGNPTGEVLDRKIILDVVAWARSRQIHVVFDELYALSVHGDASFISAAEALDGDLGNDLHVMWSFSKDFCVSGLRFGIFFSKSSELLQCIGQASLFSDVSRQTQWTIQNLLSDELWISKFLSENKRRLAAAYNNVVELLERSGVPYVPAKAGFYVLIDLRQWLEGPPSRESEMELWRKILDLRVILTPGSECFSQTYGWFRLCFASMSIETVQIAWKRIEESIFRNAQKRSD